MPNQISRRARVFIQAARRDLQKAYLWLTLPPTAAPPGWFHLTLQFLEHNFVILPLGIIGSIVAVIFPPLFTLLGACFLLGLHRSKAVAGKPRLHQLVAYTALSIGSFVGLSMLSCAIQRRLSDTNTSLARLMASFVPNRPATVGEAPASAKPLRPPENAPISLETQSATEKMAPTPPRPRRAAPTTISRPDTSTKPKTMAALLLSAVLTNPTDPMITVENHSDDVAESVTWELVMWRKKDRAFLSYTTQSIGYVKPHSRSASYSLNLNTLPRAPGGGELADGDVCAGSIAVDCPKCGAITLAVGFVWGRSGWFYEVPGLKGFLRPKVMSEAGITNFIDLLTGNPILPSARRQAIEPLAQ